MLTLGSGVIRQGVKPTYNFFKLQKQELSVLDPINFSQYQTLGSTIQILGPDPTLS